MSHPTPTPVPRGLTPRRIRPPPEQATALVRMTQFFQSSNRVHKVSKPSLMLEVLSNVFAFALYGYYWFAVLTTPPEVRRASKLYQLLFGFVVTATYR